MNNLDLNALIKEVKANKKYVKSGSLDVYELVSTLSEKYMKPLDSKWGKRKSSEEDIYTDILFTVIECCGIELY